MKDLCKCSLDESHNAFDKRLTTPLAEELIQLYAQYVEGGIEESKQKYNYKLQFITTVDIVYIVYRTPFERQSVQLSHLLSFIPKEVEEKLKKNKEYLSKFSK